MTETLPKPFGSGVRAVVRPLASPRLTVLLLALSIVLVFAGTLAQTTQSLWEGLPNYSRIPILGDLFS